MKIKILSTVILLAAGISGCNNQPQAEVEQVEEVQDVIEEKNVNTMDIPTKDGIFITNSVHGVRIAKSLLNQRLQRSPVADKIAAAYDAALVTGALDKPEDD